MNPHLNRFSKVGSICSFPLFPSFREHFGAKSFFYYGCLVAVIWCLCVWLSMCYIYRLFTPCHSADMDLVCLLKGERFESVISWRNKEAAVRRSPEGKVVYSPSPLRVLINTGELFWQKHWIECKSQIPGTSKWDRLSVHPQTTETPPLWGNMKSHSQGSSDFQGWQE